VNVGVKVSPKKSSQDLGDGGVHVLGHGVRRCEDEFGHIAGRGERRRGIQGGRSIRCPIRQRDLGIDRARFVDPFELVQRVAPVERITGELDPQTGRFEFRVEIRIARRGEVVLFGTGIVA
jgi:hypothetical protein